MALMASWISGARLEGQYVQLNGRQVFLGLLEKVVEKLRVLDFHRLTIFHNG